MSELEHVAPSAPVTVERETLEYLGLDPNNVATRALVLLAQRYQLDPLLGEIQLIADRNGRKLYVTRDGMLAVAHASGQLDGIVVTEQRRNTEGNGWTAYVEVWRKDMGHPFRYGAQCKDNEDQAKRGNGPEMALARAERRALKRAFRIRSDFYPERPDIEDYEADDSAPASLSADAVAPREVSTTRPPAAPSPDEFVAPSAEQEQRMRYLRSELGLDGRTNRALWLALLTRALEREVTDTRLLMRDDIASCIDFLENELAEHDRAIAEARLAARAEAREALEVEALEADEEEAPY